MIRFARSADAAVLAEIYAPAVRDTAISFELEPPTSDEMERRLARTMPAHPWLVLEADGHVIGYAYAHAMAERAAYAWSVETSVYVAAVAWGRGVGTSLYRALLAVLTAQGYRQAIAGIRLPNPASVALHESCGFHLLGTYERVGWKFDEWHDVGWWQVSLGEDGPPSPIRTVEQLSPDELERALG